MDCGDEMGVELHSQFSFSGSQLDSASGPEAFSDLFSSFARISTTVLMNLYFQIMNWTHDI